MFKNCLHLYFSKMKTVNPDLVNERLKCSFDVDELSNFLRGGEENRKKAREVSKYAEVGKFYGYFTRL